MTESPRVLALGYLSIDRIVGPAGASEAVPGGAALYAALGARAVGARAGIVARVGEDYPASWRAAIARLGIDLSGVAADATATRRSDLFYDAAGGRASPHFDDPAWWEGTLRLAPSLPDDLRGVGAVAVGPVPVEVLEQAVGRGGRAGARLVADTSAAFALRAPAALLGLLPGLDVFAPSLEETRCLVPGAGDDEAAVALAARGVAVVQKRGAAGAYVVPPCARAGFAVPAVDPGRIADTTGAGDASVGALAALLSAGADLGVAVARAMQVGALAVRSIGPAALGLTPSVALEV